MFLFKKKSPHSPAKEDTSSDEGGITPALEKLHIEKLEDPGNLLETTYYTKVDKTKDFATDVAIQIQAGDKVVASAVPQRYVLVIDVSGSMGTTIQTNVGKVSLLERIKLFGEMMVEELPELCSVSIVTFSSAAAVALPMTKMDSNGKKTAAGILKYLRTQSSTNISDGLFKALEEIERSAKGKPTRDCIILFTDGQANQGIRHAPTLVREFRSRMMSMNRTNAVTVSGFTIGNNKPFFLNQVAAGLGSESFYCLDEKGDSFEADLLLPVLLREEPCVFDVTLEITCLAGVTFTKEDFTEPALLSAKDNTEKVFFFHFIPVKMEKNILLSLTMPKFAGENPLDRQKILQIDITFLDDSLKCYKRTEFLELRLTSMKELFLQEESRKSGASSETSENEQNDRIEALEKTACYVMKNNKIDFTMTNAEKAAARVLDQRCRVKAMTAMEATAKLVDEKKYEAASVVCNRAVADIDAYEGRSNLYLATDNQAGRALRSNISSGLSKRMAFVRKEVRSLQASTRPSTSIEKIPKKMCSAGKFQAMSSALQYEMPSNSDVYMDVCDDPFMPSHLQERHEATKQHLSELRRKKNEKK